MPRFSETARREVTEAEERFKTGDDRGGGINANITNVKAVIYIADQLGDISETLKAINDNLEIIAKIFEQEPGPTVLEQRPVARKTTTTKKQ